ncbi:phosphatase PAP2 family protein [Ramlibacter sp. PS3R-8]|uniref:phosphatase PAP2 family protein n=1 Tax=Ramlibacter sp. PS3R-8 TaxID=3133437 RepID=UPI0030986401
MQPRIRWTVVGVALSVFLLLSLLLTLGNSLAAFDLQVTQFLHARRTPWLSHAMLFVSDAHETVRILAVTVLVAMWRLYRRDRAAAAALVVVPFGQLLNVGLKHVFQRPRPVVPEPLVHLATYSFPSGHAVASTLFYGMLCALVLQRVRSPAWRAAAAAAAVAMILLVAFSRVYLGAHYLGDVVAGIAVGTACVAGVLKRAR